MSTTTVNPSLLSSPSTSTAPSPAPSHDSAAPPRKRPRSELTSEERKEARAHRNRIAAQNSRDRRKAHYSHLEQRVAELEEENRRLREGQMEFIAPPSRTSLEAEKVRERARERENEELKERIKTLEKGWDSVVKALAAQGLPTGIPAPPPTTTTADSPTQSPSAFPVIVPNSSVFPTSPNSPTSSHTSLSNGSFDFEFDVVKSESTRHLARVATTEATPPSVSLQRVDNRHINLNSLLTSRNTLSPFTIIRSQKQCPTQRWKTSSARFLSRAPLRPQRRLRLYHSLWSLLHPPPNSKSHRRPPPRRK
jgi:X box-binding protein 1